MSFFLIVFVAAVVWTVKWLAASEVRERRNRKFDESWTYFSKDYCPRCFRGDVVVVRADTTGALYGACGSCDKEVLL